MKGVLEIQSLLLCYERPFRSFIFATLSTNPFSSYIAFFNISLENKLGNSNCAIVSVEDIHIFFLSSNAGEMLTHMMIVRLNEL